MSFGIEGIYIVAPEWADDSRTLPWTCLKPWYFGLSESHYLDFGDEKDNFENAIRKNSSKNYDEITRILEKSRVKKEGLSFSDLLKVSNRWNNIKVTAIVGENGCGKSQLLTLLCQLVEIEKNKSNIYCIRTWGWFPEKNEWYIYIKFSDHKLYPILERDSFPQAITQAKRKSWYTIHNSEKQDNVWNIAHMVSWDNLIEHNKEEARIISSLWLGLQTKSKSFQDFISQIFYKSIKNQLNWTFTIEIFQNYSFEVDGYNKQLNTRLPFYDWWMDDVNGLFRILFFWCNIYTIVSKNTNLGNIFQIDSSIWGIEFEVLQKFQILAKEFVAILGKNKTPVTIDNLKYIIYDALWYFLNACKISIKEDSRVTDLQANQFNKLLYWCKIVILKLYSEHDFSDFSYSIDAMKYDIDNLNNWNLRITYWTTKEWWHIEDAINFMKNKISEDTYSWWVSNWKWNFYRNWWGSNWNWFCIDIDLQLISHSFIQQVFQFKSHNRDYYDFLTIPFEKIKIKNDRGKERSISQFSSWEISLIKRILRNIMYEILKNNQKKSYVICIDEPDLYLHIRRQKKYIDWIVDILSKVTSKQFHLILSTHSPFIVSDIPENNLLILEKGKDITKSIIEKEWNTFASTTFDIVSDYMWMSDGRDIMIGDFTKEAIDWYVKKMKELLIKKRNRENENINNQANNEYPHQWEIEKLQTDYSKIIDWIWDPILKEYLLLMHH